MKLKKSATDAESRNCSCTEYHENITERSEMKDYLWFCSWRAFFSVAWETICSKAQSKEKELPRSSGITPEFDWRPQRDLNPRYRRESQKI
ncbi:MAG: hypothetical protein M0R70_04765 [Nitrospirae bacterium]|nr:hypothetical protein [Nitrospirota bacterium]